VRSDQRIAAKCRNFAAMPEIFAYRQGKRKNNTAQTGEMLYSTVCAMQYL
jgi:hypothetical protein